MEAPASQPAIAGAAFGTKKIKKVDKIIGPGNSLVVAAKKEVFGDVGIEGMTAGPSEVMIIADKTSNPEWLASDLIGQAEHDPLAQCIMISKDKDVLKKTQKEIMDTTGPRIRSFCKFLVTSQTPEHWASSRRQKRRSWAAGMGLQC